MDELKTLAVTVDARGIATVALQRGDVLNAFDETMIAELTDAFTTLGRRDDVRAIVLRSDGRAFCAGADLQWMQRASANDAAANLRDAEQFAAMMRAIRQCPKPTVARVQGHAFGGGVGLCAACDILIASDHARFSVSESRFG
uniref:enoyl-CoA hydratase-related protein n=1 Tax=Burkholderia cenocepacia TaxID=95486 RepID=UPI001F4AC09F